MTYELKGLFENKSSFFFKNEYNTYNNEAEWMVLVASKKYLEGIMMVEALNVEILKGIITSLNRETSVGVKVMASRELAEIMRGEMMELPVIPSM